MNQERVAVHEAGHAVAAAILRVPFGKVTIIPDGNTGGSTAILAGRGYKISNWVESSSDNYKRRTEQEIASLVRQKDLAKAKNYAKVLMAGGAAEELVYGLGNTSPNGMSKDIELMVELFAEVGVQGSEQSLFLTYFNRATSLVFRNFVEVTVVAYELLKHKELSASRIREIVRNAPFAPANDIYKGFCSRIDDSVVGCR